MTIRHAIKRRLWLVSAPNIDDPGRTDVLLGSCFSVVALYSILLDHPTETRLARRIETSFHHSVSDARRALLNFLFSRLSELRKVLGSVGFP